MQSTILVGVVTDTGTLGPHPAFLCGRKYVDAVIDGADALAVLLPAVAQSIDALLATVDGLLFTGSYSDIDPALYDAAALPASVRPPRRDPERDATALPLLRAAIDNGTPVLAICRGLQELNVSLGGTLHQALHILPDHLDHRDSDRNAPAQRAASDACPSAFADVSPDSLALRYGPAHSVELTKGGLLQSLFNTDSCTVNSLHGQGIDRLAEHLLVEAIAPDGVIEAVRSRNTSGFVVGVQWHPEWQFANNPQSVALFKAFGDACRQYRYGRMPASTS